MRIDFDTADLAEADGLALAVLIHAKFPSVLSTLSTMTAGAALLSRAAAAVHPEEAFGGEDAPAAVAPSAEEAFAGGPPSAGVDTSPSMTGDGGPPADASTDAPAHTGTIASPAASTASPSNGPELDADGLPHDVRIHSSNGKKTANGKWFAKRGVSNHTVATVTAELKALLSGPLASTTAAVAPSAPVAPTSSTVTPAAPVAATAPPPPAAPAVAAPPVPPAPAPDTSIGAPGVSPATTQTFPPEVARAAEAAMLADVRPPGLIFTEVMRAVTDFTLAGKLTPEDLEAVCTACGLTSPRELIQKPSVAPAFLETLNAFVASKG